MRIGVVTFPGSLDDTDAARAVELCGGQPVRLWHADADLRGVDAVVLPGGFSYGDYLRCGAIAHRARVVSAIAGFAAAGGPVLGICNGFQILCEARLLPGALLRNAGLRFVCRPVDLVVDGTSPWTVLAGAGTTMRLPVKHGEGRYYAPAAVLDRMETGGQVLLRYAPGQNPNGSERDIAAVTNDAGNVVGLMPHPEHAVDPELGAGTDGRLLFESILVSIAARA